MRMIAIVILAAGILAHVYGGFSATPGRPTKRSWAPWSSPSVRTGGSTCRSGREWRWPPWAAYCCSKASREILRVDHLAVAENEVLAVIGPNGSGKSTLLLCLARLIKPQAGEILFRGTALADLNELSYRRRIGLVLQEPLLLDTSVHNNVAAGLRFRRLPHQEVEQSTNAWLNRLGIGHLSQRSARSLSGGEAQRASLARAFALQPEILLLDEPFSALDAPTRIRLLEDLQALLRATSLTTVFITHDLDEALALGDRVRNRDQ